MTGQSETDLAERAALQVRQGEGARYDASNAPAEDLLLVRRGTAYFARELNNLSDAQLDGGSLVSGWSRRHVIADISYHARAMAIALKGIRETLTPEEANWEPDVELAATLPARALRHLYAHSVVHLNVEFRDLKKEDWDKTISLSEGDAIPIRTLPFLRGQKVWRGAFNLGNGTREADLPERLREQ
jgi:maleylpyruvate isomerase